jgi:very-short-patch-repair endonuclease
MVVVSSIRGENIKPTGSIGALTLKRYLTYAEKGVTALRSDPLAVDAISEEQVFDSPFEQAVFDALTAKGLRLVTQVGCSGYRIDLAARDPEQPDRYVLGIECDGRSYHSSKTARDRDRLRQAHLESLGWTIHRIWSSDWFANPEREIEKTLRAFTEARERHSGGASERVS